jgi:hypothetical protein
MSISGEPITVHDTRTPKVGNSLDVSSSNITLDGVAEGETGNLDGAGVCVIEEERDTEEVIDTELEIEEDTVTEDDMEQLLEEEDVILGVVLNEGATELVILGVAYIELEGVTDKPVVGDTDDVEEVVALKLEETEEVTETELEILVELVTERSVVGDTLDVGETDIVTLDDLLTELVTDGDDAGDIKGEREMLVLGDADKEEERLVDPYVKLALEENEVDLLGVPETDRNEIVVLEEILLVGPKL